MFHEVSGYIAYSCPLCGQITKRKIDLFHMNNKKNQFKCANKKCGAPILTVTQKKDKYIFDLSCAVCGEFHTFTISKDGLWTSGQTIFPCPQAMVDIFAIGNEKEIDDYIRKYQESYLNAKMDLQSDPFIDLYFRLVTLVDKIWNENKITCSLCGGNAADIELTDDGVMLTCRKCRGRKLIKATESEYKKLSKSGIIVLE